MRKCPKCNGVSVQTERRPDGDSKCVDCSFSGKTYLFDGPKKEIRIALNEKVFRSLVRGGQVTLKMRGGTDVALILQDIGHELMHTIIDIAEEDSATKGLIFKDESIVEKG